MLVARQPEDSTDVRPQHILAQLLIKVGKYAEDTKSIIMVSFLIFSALYWPPVFSVER